MMRTYRDRQLEQMGLLLSEIPQASSSKPVRTWTPEPIDLSDSLFDQDFDEFMESLDNLEPFDDLEDWSDDVDLFMDALRHPPYMADALWQEAKSKKPGRTHSRFGRQTNLKFEYSYNSDDELDNLIQFSKEAET